MPINGLHLKLRKKTQNEHVQHRCFNAGWYLDRVLYGLMYHYQVLAVQTAWVEHAHFESFMLCLDCRPSIIADHQFL